MKNKKIFLTIKDISQLANLAKLKLTEKEMSRYKKQLEETLDYVVNLNQLKTKDVNSLSNFDYLKNSFFKDGGKNKRGLNQKQLKENLKAKGNQYFAVKRIL